jgi:hypothetical protein
LRSPGYCTNSGTGLSTISSANNGAQDGTEHRTNRGATDTARYGTIFWSRLVRQRCTFCIVLLIATHIDSARVYQRVIVACEGCYGTPVEDERDNDHQRDRYRGDVPASLIV